MLLTKSKRHLSSPYASELRVVRTLEVAEEEGGDVREVGGDADLRVQAGVGAQHTGQPLLSSRHR